MLVRSGHRSCHRLKHVHKLECGNAVSDQRAFSRGRGSDKTIVLGLESSADDTCAAIVDSDRVIRANVVLHQKDLLEQWGGINPYHATARHQKNMAQAIADCLDHARLGVADVDAIAYTRGPGMPSCLASCSLAAKTLSAAFKKPLIGVHHMQAHALTVGLTEQDPPAYPYLTLLVSGGHTLLLLANSPFEFKLLATSHDDSIGDAYDKAARLLSLPWDDASSGGQALERFVGSHTVDAAAYPTLRIPMPGRLEFSYSGLKSALRKEVEAGKADTLEQKRNLAAAFQLAAVGQLEEKVRLSLRTLEVRPSALVVSGGVASNWFLRRSLRACLDRAGNEDMRLLFPPVSLCTDNAAMIAWAALERYNRQMYDTFDSPLRPKWSITDCADLS